MKTSSALCGLISGLLVLAAGTSTSRAALIIPSGLNPGDTYHLVFVTLGTTSASSSNIVDYNAFVQAQAELSGSLTENSGIIWSAIGSTPTVAARDNAVVSAPVYNMDGDLLATGFADMWDGAISDFIGVDQFGDPRTTSRIWTGSTTGGFGAASSLELGGSGARYGRNDSYPGPEDWIDGNTATTGSYPMYALSGTITVVPEPSSALLSLVAIAAIGLRRRRS